MSNNLSLGRLVARCVWQEDDTRATHTGWTTAAFVVAATLAGIPVHAADAAAAGTTAAVRPLFEQVRAGDIVELHGVRTQELAELFNQADLKVGLYEN
jgi:hypothetical protein